MVALPLLSNPYFPTVPLLLEPGMTIHPLLQDSTATAVPGAAVYDSVWSDTVASTNTPLEAVMLTDGKLYVVLVVVLLIWSGLLLFLFRNDRRITRLERLVAEQLPDTPHDP
jgi:hypothetical protein